MKTGILFAGLVAGFLVLPAISYGQCQARGASSGSTGTTASVALPRGNGTSVVTSGQLLTSPGSLYHDMLMQQQVQQAIAQQQYMLAAQKAAKAKAKFEVRLANAQKRRSEAAYKLEIDRAKRSTALAKQ